MIIKCAKCKCVITIIPMYVVDLEGCEIKCADCSKPTGTNSSVCMPYGSYPR